MSRTTEKTLTLLELVADGSRTLGELAERSGMPKSTVHRLAKSLLEGGYLRHDGRDYLLGYKLLELGERVKRELRLPHVARDAMVRLSEETSETVHLGELDGSHVVYLEKVDGSRGLQMASYVGLRSPAQTTAMGKVLLAALPPEEARGRLLRLEPRTPHSITEPDAILAELEQVRARGYAFDREENEIGIRCLAAPVVDAAGDVIAAVSVSGATQFVTKERQRALVPVVQACADGISARLGASRNGRGPATGPRRRKA